LKPGVPSREAEAASSTAASGAAEKDLHDDADADAAFAPDILLLFEADLIYEMTLLLLERNILTYLGLLVLV